MMEREQTKAPESGCGEKETVEIEKKGRDVKSDERIGLLALKTQKAAWDCEAFENLKTSQFEKLQKSGGKWA
ncbi:unnamed protein product [Nippostrongylus brasiliensis]|uniref:RanBD1 domain-containing protein n=1 Tax=Nippostrongylus brasiliensis TaxID=27835 RepID=A0A0N4YHR5_NIPBR|nr:unnamed protein product [Nippostrongylus brasiliensis]